MSTSDAESAPPAPPGPDARLRTRALAVIATVLTVAALRLSEPVTLPLVLAVFLIAFTWPLYLWVERRTRSWVALLASTLVVVLAGAVLAGAVALSVAQVTARGPELVRRATSVGEQLRTWLTAHGLPAPKGGGDSGVLSGIASAIGTLLGSTAETLTLLGLTFAYYVLGVLEVRAFRDKARRALRPPGGDETVRATADIAHRVRGYLWAVTVTSLVAGAAAGAFAWAVGLDGALTWALTTFLLNYIQTIGPFLSVIPPTLYAVIQGDGPGHVALVFLGLGAIQFFIGNFVDPKVSASRVSLSPLVVLVATTFWGWLWGATGALLAVPLTVAVAGACERFARTRWIATMLGDGK
ncbi:membrane protein [Gemmatimonadetes bacterium T265]|nr:membrane protein [Gemmatimonadetes bacterium T265]